MTGPDERDRMSEVGAIVLAAGASTRFGTPKQLALLAGETLLARAVRVAGAAGCAPVIAVVGANAELLSGDGSLAGARLVVNPDWAEGMASSIRAGVRALAGEAEGVILMTCDQPAVTSAHLRLLAARDPQEISASSYAGRLGVPAYFPALFFPELLSLAGDRGAHALLASAPAVPLLGGELDIDTPERLAIARSLYENA